MAKTLVVNSNFWDQASTELKQSLKKTLADSGLLDESDTIVGHPNVRELADDDLDAFVEELEAKYSNVTCLAKCRAAYEAAKVACNLFPFPGDRKNCKKTAARAYELCLAACLI